MRQVMSPRANEAAKGEGEEVILALVADAIVPGATFSLQQSHRNF